jgi:deoxycytidylate deaminase
MKDKFIKKYMRIAKFIGEDQNPCHSRKIGAIIVDPIANRILGTGYNGPPPGTPHPTTLEYLRDYFWPQLTDDEKISLQSSLGGVSDIQVTCNHDFGPITKRCLKCSISDCDLALFQAGKIGTVKEEFLRQYVGKEICPRRIINAGPGQRTELCSCGHAERHAITNAACPLQGMVIFCWCGVPCLQCTDAIIQAGIKEVHCVIQPDYHTKSRWLFEKANVTISEYPEKELLCAE